MDAGRAGVFQIGEFSHLAQLSVRVLRHYDEIGLLPPAEIDPVTGYRYYEAGQLGDVHRIVAMKELGLSLDQIRQLLREGTSSTELRAMLRVELLRAEQARADAERRLRELEGRLAELDDDGLAGIDIVEKSVPAQPALLHRTVVTDFAAAERLVEQVAAVRDDVVDAGPLVVVGHGPSFDTSDVDVEIGFPSSGAAAVPVEPGRWSLEPSTLPAVPRLLAVVASDSLPGGHRRAHHAIGRWLERHDCRLCGPGRELIHGLELDGTPTVEIQYPVATR